MSKLYDVVGEGLFSHLGDKSYSPGPWSLTSPGGELNPWEHTNTAVVQDDGSVTFAHKWPDAIGKTGVRGYNYVTQGLYWDEKNPAPTFKNYVQIGAVKKFLLTFDYAVQGSQQNQNVLMEYFVRDCRDPKDTKTATLTAEIGWMLSMPKETAAWVKSGKYIGQFQNPGGSMWEIRMHYSGAAGVYYIIFPIDLGPRAAANDMDALIPLKLLIGQPGVAASSYIYGVAIGSEPTKSASTLTVKKFSRIIQ